jgi:mannose-6-phosphate isomerase-like protein (cupin superfamily)
MAGLPDENMIDAAEALRSASYDGAIWSVNAPQMNVNLMRLSAGAGIPEHVNAELDVLLVFLEGEGELVCAGEGREVGPGIAAVIPAGLARSLRCTRGPLVYVSCHRQRGGLMPSDPRPRSDQQQRHGDG